ncbi:hypothetical protein H5410_053137, partial [Solanum commersonii]
GASGIGLETTRVLALRKAHVIIAARNMEAANEAKQRILNENRTARHFYLTNLLLDKVKETAKSTGIEGRIVNLSSVAHLVCPREGIRFHNINDKNSYQDKVAYGQSKLANLLHANELSRRLNLKYFHLFTVKECLSGGSYNLLLRPSSKFKGSDWKVLF